LIVDLGEVSLAITEILQMLLLIGVKIVLKYLFNVGILEKHLDALNLSGICVNTLFKSSSLFLQLYDLRGKGCMLDGFLQEIVVGDEDRKLRLLDLRSPLFDLV
jgi:hypothetical protein